MGEGFRFVKVGIQKCELALNLSLAINSLTNYAHIVLFTFLFVMTSPQFRMSHWSGFAWAACASVTMGVLVELAEGISGNGHCHLRDIIPDAVGILLGCGIVFLWNKVRKQPQAT